jgi:shikimate kinase
VGHICSRDAQYLDARSPSLEIGSDRFGLALVLHSPAQPDGGGSEATLHETLLTNTGAFIRARYGDTMSIVLAGRSLVLIGFMGSGKSSVGRELAKRWNFRFVDTDAMIRHKYDLSIPDIFAKHGEDFFREAEYQALVRLRGISSTIIATGGGIVVQPRNLPLLRSLGPVVWLCADQTTILDRVGKSTHRPMLNQANPEESVAKLLKERAPLYHQAADLRIETSGLTHREVADRIVFGLDKFRGTDE